MERSETAPHDALTALRQRAEREINEGLLPAAQFQSRNQVVSSHLSHWAIALITLFPIFSCTSDHLLAGLDGTSGGQVQIDDPVSFIPEFGSNDKDGVTPLLTLPGFPNTLSTHGLLGSEKG